MHLVKLLLILLPLSVSADLLQTKILDTADGLATVTILPNGQVFIYDTGSYNRTSSIMKQLEEFLGSRMKLN